MDQQPAQQPAHNAPRWQPLSAVDRRVVGVLAEKAKTTPDIYPMSLNAITTGCNQKNNRSPLMQLEPADVEESLERLRAVGAIGMVEGYGRVQKYRHYLYDWLGVDKVEIAVMTELLLRGDQTLGELRGRAARMEPIADQAALLPVIESLKAKRLVIALTSEGRGQVVSHGLYKPREIEALQTKYAGYDSSRPASHGDEEVAEVGHRQPSASPVRPSPSQAVPVRSAPSADVSNELSSLRQQVAHLEADIEELRNAQGRTADELRLLKESLGG